MSEFSSRSKRINEERDRLITVSVEKRSKRPSSATIIKMRAQATLATRPEKQIHSLADLTTQWRRYVGKILGTNATDWAREVIKNEAPLLLRADDLPLDVLRGLGESVVGTVGEKRSN